MCVYLQLGVTITYDRSSVGWRVEGARQEYPHQVPWILSRQLELLLIRDTRDQVSGGTHTPYIFFT